MENAAPEELICSLVLVVGAALNWWHSIDARRDCDAVRGTRPSLIKIAGRNYRAALIRTFVLLMFTAVEAVAMTTPPAVRAAVGLLASVSNGAFLVACVL